MVCLENNQLMITLQNEFNIYVVEELKKLIDELFDEAQSVTVSLKNVQSFDSSGFSLLVSLQKEVLQGGKTIAFNNLSTEVMEYLATMNVLEFFEGGKENE